MDKTFEVDSVSQLLGIELLAVESLSPLIIRLSRLSESANIFIRLKRARFSAGVSTAEDIMDAMVKVAPDNENSEICLKSENHNKASYIRY